MRVEAIEVFSTTTNVAVVRVPGRAFPGSVIQGDSLSILVGHARVIADRIRTLDLADDLLCGDAEELLELLLDRLLHYQAVLDQAGIGLPYGRRFSEADMIRLTTDHDG